jgi:energy-coupling factor transporter ATP-binding protein EcfA2
MSILKAIQEWSLDIPSWQQDAVARIFSKGKLESLDLDDLYALLKVGHGIPDPEGRVARPLRAGYVPDAPSPGTAVCLVSIRDLEHVNALASNQTLTIQPSGLTAIYGGNGAGKSGYSRVLKRACRARDQDEGILADARLPPNKAARAKAKFDVVIDGAPSELSWTDGAQPPKELGAIAIFDARCARAYIDAADDFSYVPYGLDILEGLAKACASLKAKLDTERSQTVPNLLPFSALAAGPTQVGIALRSVTAKTKPESIDSLANLSNEQLSRHAALEKGLKEGNPKEKAQQLMLRRNRFVKLADRCKEKIALVAPAAVDALKTLVNAARTARAAADLAAKNFRETPGQLAGTGGEVWQELFAAARKFAADALPDRQFPDLGPDAPCPLCQQPLGEASARLVAFDAFLQQEAEKLARAKRSAAKAAYEAIRDANIDLQFDQDIRSELHAINPELANSFENLGPALTERRKELLAACAEDGDWNAIGEELQDPSAQLNEITSKISEEIKVLEKATDEKAIAAMLLEFNELAARIQLSPLKGAVLDAIDKHVLQAKLLACQASVKTNAISAKSTELVDQVVSKGLAAALNAEFAKLRVDHLKVKVRSNTIKGKTYHKLVLELPGAETPADILSEGEQRAIAIASFLAEVNLGGGTGASCSTIPCPRLIMCGANLSRGAWLRRHPNARSLSSHMTSTFSRCCSTNPIGWGQASRP